MGAVFTPGLAVAERQVLLKDRRLPLEGEVTVQVGQRVAATDVVARTRLPGKVYPVNVANQLGIDAGRLPGFMRRKAGEHVEKDDVVARTPGLLGLFASEARAPVAGTIESVSPITGMVIFQADPVPVEVDAYVNGRVVELIPGEGCVVQSVATLVQGIFGLGGEARGEIALGVDGPEEELGAEGLGEQHRGKVLIGGAWVSIAAVRKAATLGVRAIVTGGFDYDEVKELLGYEVGVAITGGERFGLTLVVTEGFGRIPMAPATFALLKSKVGKVASVNGATQIRAGVIRPEIVVTHDEEEVPAEKWIAPEPSGIAVGDAVRGIREPWFGRIGRVTALPVDAVELETETRVRVLEVEFAGGERARIPRSNVESIGR